MADREELVRLIEDYCEGLASPAGAMTIANAIPDLLEVSGYTIVGPGEGVERLAMRAASCLPEVLVVLARGPGTYLLVPIEEEG